MLLAVTDLGPRPGEGPAFLSAVLTDGTLFPLAALAIVLPLFLPIAVAITAGEAIAGEAAGARCATCWCARSAGCACWSPSWSAVMAFVVVTVLVVAATAYVVGCCCWATQSVTASGATTSVSGTSLSTPELVGRTFLALGYAMLCMLGVAAIALFLSTVASSSLGAALGTMAVFVASTLLLTLDASEALSDYLPTRYWLAFVDLFRDPILWRDVQAGVILQVAYVVVFFAAAWANFATKDITD